MKKGLLSKIFFYVLIIFMIYPILVLITWSFTKRWPWPYIFPTEYSLRGFLNVFSSNSKTLSALINSILISLSVTAVTLIISIPGAKAIGIYDFRGKKFIKMAMLAPIIVPPSAVCMGIHVAFIKAGLANTFLGVVLVHLIPCIPYGIRILTNVFEIVGQSMELQARNLGASWFKAFIYVTLPLIMPGILSAGSLIFIVSFSQYFLTFLIGGGQVVTLPIIMFPYIQSGDRIMASSYSIIFIASSLLLLLLVEKMVKFHYKIENHFYI